jgi:hypothetical protein
MNVRYLDQKEAEILSFEVSDEVLEGAAATETAANFTLGDCTALSVCPAW